MPGQGAYCDSEKQQAQDSFAEKLEPFYLRTARPEKHGPGETFSDALSQLEQNPVAVLLLSMFLLILI